MWIYYVGLSISAFMIFSGIIVFATDSGESRTSTFFIVLVFLSIALACYGKIKKHKNKDSFKKSEYRPPLSEGEENVMPFSVNVKFINDDIPDGVLSGMRETYSREQIKGDIRILKECLDILENTDNLETFFSRHNLAMQKTMSLMQAKKSGIKVELSDDFPKLIANVKSEACAPVLLKSYEKFKKGVEELKTAKGKKGRYLKYRDLLIEFDNEYEFDGHDEYISVLEEVEQKIKEYSS